MDQQTAVPQDGFERMTVEEFNTLRRPPQISSMTAAGCRAWFEHRIRNDDPDVIIEITRISPYWN